MVRLLLEKSVDMSKGKEEPLVSREQLDALIDGMQELEPYREFIKRRWVGMVMWWHNRSVEARHLIGNRRRWRLWCRMSHASFQIRIRERGQ
jgi:hypothetical protein